MFKHISKNIKNFLTSNAYPFDDQLSPIEEAPIRKRKRGARLKTEQGRLEDELINNLKSDQWCFTKHDESSTFTKTTLLTNKINGTQIKYKMHRNSHGNEKEIEIIFNFFSTGAINIESAKIRTAVEKVIERLKKRNNANNALNRIRIFRQLIDCLESWSQNKFCIPLTEVDEFKTWLKVSMRGPFYRSMQKKDSKNAYVRVWTKDKEDYLLLLLKYEGK